MAQGGQTSFSTGGIGQYYVTEQLGYNEHNIHATTPSTRISNTHSPLYVDSFPSNTRQRDTAQGIVKLLMIN